MPSFKLSVVDREGNLKKLELKASCAAEVDQYVLTHQYVLIDQVENKSFEFKTNKAFNLVLFLNELHALLQSGLSLIETLEALAERQTSAQDQLIIQQLITAIYQGNAFSVALKQQPSIFPDLLYATIAATEQTGEMIDGLARYLRYSEQMGQIKAKVISASIYPLTLLVIGSVVGLFLLLYLVPKFSLMYDSLSADLPLMSKLLFQWGAFVAQNKILVAGVFAGLIGLSIFAYTQPSVRMRIIEKIQQISWIKSHVHLMMLSRFYRALGLLLNNGTPIIQALNLTQSLLPQRLQSNAAQLKLDIQQGKKISDSLASQQLTTPISIRLIKAGEQNGQIAEMLEKSADFHDVEISRWVDKLTKMLEPILMLVLGAIIGTIVILLYLPIFDMVGSAQ